MMMLSVLALSWTSPHAIRATARVSSRAHILANTFDPLNATRSAFESTVRSVTGDDDYQFGDWTRGTISELSGKEASEYQFGDITKKAVAEFTGKDAGNYEFGDLTRAALSKTDAALADARDSYFSELPTVLWRQLFGGMTEPQRREAAIALCQLGAVALLCLGVVNGALLGLQTLCAWIYVSHATGLSPLAPGQWGAFLETHATLRLALDVPLLPVRVLGAFCLIPSYRDLTTRLQRRLPGRDTLLNRAAALLLAWLGANLLAVGGTTALGVWASSRWLGVPLGRPTLPVW